MKKYFLSATANFEGDINDFDGWLYTKTPKGNYINVALMNSDFDPSFTSRRQLIKDQGIDVVRECYDYSADNPPNGAVQISEARAKKIIKIWKKRNKELWPKKKVKTSGQ